MMKVATILPVPMLFMAEGDNYHLCLTHLVQQSKEYADFFERQSRRGAFVIIDNGAAEGTVQPIQRVVDAAYRVQARELVLPDEIYDMKKTLLLAEDALDYLHYLGDGPRVMGVPHGETFDEWKKCARELAVMGVHTLGISKFITPKYGVDARFHAVRFILECLIPHFPRLSIHLLGCWNHPREIGTIVQNLDHPAIRGTDSAIAYVYTAGGVQLRRVEERPEIEIDFLNGTVEDFLLQYNKDAWREFCCGTL